jgi:hypothetical protein
MKKILIIPHGWPCTLNECPPGHFMIDDELCFKAVHVTAMGGCPVAYFSTGGGYMKDPDELVQPVVVESWEDGEIDVKELT